MSENWLRLVPTVPAWVPDGPAEARGLAALLALVPEARSVKAEVYDQVELVAHSPGRPELSAAEMADVEAAVGHPLRQVWQHL